ncbi:MAG: class I SAM-dependent methyltransferase [Actinomycetota bacterium]
MAERSAFSGGDQAYLRSEQYGDGSKLSTRMSLHARFGTAITSFPDFAAALVPWRSGGRALDCGTGTGMFWTNAASPRDTSLTLVDLSPGMVDEATTRARASGFSDVAGREADAQSLPFDDESFDVVVANHMLYHVPDPGRALDEFARVLTDEGVLIASTNGRGHMAELIDAIVAVFGTATEALTDNFGIDTGRPLLERRFGSVTWHDYENELVVDDLDAALAYATSFPPGDAATADQLAGLRSELDRRSREGILRITPVTGAFVARQR